MMQHATLARNTFLLTVASIGQKIVAFVYFTIIANVFGDANTGAYFLALALVTTIGVLDDVGLTSLLTREIARKTETAADWLQTALGYKLCTIPLTVLLAFVLPALLHYSSETASLVHAAVAVMLADTFSLTFYGVLRGLQRVRYESLGLFTGQFFTTALGIVLIVTGEATLFRLVCALIVGSVWNMLYSGFHVVRVLGWQALLPAYRKGFAPLKAAFAFFLAAVFVKVYGYLDSFVLHAYWGEATVGVYSVAYKLTYAFQFLPLVFVGALYPAMSSAAHDIDALRKIFFAAEWYLALLVMPIVGGIFGLAPEIIALLYPSGAFTGAGPVLTVLIFVLLAIFLDFPIGSFLNATGRQYTKTWIMGGTMLVNMIMNFALVPTFGMIGAAIAAAVSFLFMFGAGFFVVAPLLHVGAQDFVRVVWRFVLGAFVMTLTVLLVKPLLPLLVVIPIGAGVYAAMLIILGALTRSHVAQLRDLFRRKLVYVEGTSPHARE